MANNNGDVSPSEMELAARWIAATVQTGPTKEDVQIECVEQGWDEMKYGRSVAGQPLCLNGKNYSIGLGTHADSIIRIILPGAGARLSALGGVDDSPLTRPFMTECRCSVEIPGRTLFESSVLTAATAPAKVDVELHGAREIVLKAKGVTSIRRAHFSWVDLNVTLENGTQLRIGQPHNFTSEPRFSFIYGGVESKELLKRCVKTHSVRQAADNKGVKAIHDLRWRDERTGLEISCELKEFSDFPAAEWVVRFKNTSDRQTPLLENIQALDTSWETFDDPTLHRHRGGNWFQHGGDDFAPVADVIKPGSSVAMSCTGGRSSGGWMPYFNLDTAGSGVIGAIGWTGQWAFSCRRSDKANNRNVRLVAGMEKTRLVLNPGEEIRTPAMTLLFWSDSSLHATNMFRRLMLQQYTPQQNGKPVQAPFCSAAWGGVTSARQLENMPRLWRNDLKYECYWIDAGWFGASEECVPNLEKDGVWYKYAGDWRVNPKAHPQTLKPISDLAHQHGLKFLLWIEPERALDGTPTTKAHPEWFIGERGPGKSLLLNLGDPQARTHITDVVSNLIRDNGMDFYRQDFNFSPLPYWEMADTPDRVGMAEIKYIEGLYAFLDELRARHPGLVIDNCASGGQRLDTEMCKRSIPLWRSDAQCAGAGFNVDQGQTQTYYLAQWVPVNSTGVAGRNNDTYYVRSGYSSGLIFTPFTYEDGTIDEKTYPFEWHRKLMAEYYRVRPYYYGDFYPLAGLRNRPETQDLSSKEALVAYQFDRSDLNSGIVFAFRHEQCPVASIEVKLNSLSAEALYEVEDLDSGKIERKSGKELLENGLRVDFSKPRESRGFVYRKG
jgi:alpha-galactosidase